MAKSFWMQNFGDGLLGHCPVCHDIAFAAFKDFPGQYDNLVGKCLTCKRDVVLVDDGCECTKCHQQELSQRVQRVVQNVGPIIAGIAAQNRAAAAVQQPQMVACSWCGSPRPQGFRFCPHCRLDTLGRPADAGGFNFRSDGS